MTTSKKKAKKFTDDRLRGVLRKPWVEFIRLDGEKECLRVIQHFFGSRRADLTHFHAVTRGVNLLDFAGHPGYYMEIGGTQAPEGPLFPGPVHPILAFKMSRTRKSTIPYRFKLEGVYNSDKSKAWLKTDLWERVLGDETYFEKHVIDGHPIDTRNRIR